MRNDGPGNLGIYEPIFGNAKTYRSIGYAERARFYKWEHTISYDQEFYTQFLPTPKTVLEVPCGTGKNLIWWAKRGCFATGVDIEPQMIHQARAQIRLNKLADRAQVIAGDMRSFAISKRFDLIAVPADAFQFLMNEADILACLQTLRKRLKHSGRLVLDIGMFDQNKENGGDCFAYFNPCQPNLSIVFDWQRPIDNDGRLLRFHAQDIQESRVVFHFYYQLHKNGLQDRMQTTITLRRYETTDELVALAAHAGLNLRACYGDYHGASMTLCSPRNILVFGRNNVDN